MHLMKHLLILISVLIFSGSVCAQAFEGKIIYQNSYVSKMSNISNEQLSSTLGTRQEYYIKGASYRSISNGLAEFTLYVPTENRIYMKLNGNDTLKWLDAGTDPNKVLKVVINKKVAKVLDFECDEAILTTEHGVEKYYFSSDLSVDKNLFEKHAFGHWYDLISATGSLPLKSIVETPQFITTSEAVEVVRTKLNEKDFLLPKDSKIEKDPTRQ